jgi:hypothetical protein
MERLKFLSLLAVLSLLDCRENRVSVADGELLVQPSFVDFGQTWKGHRATASIELQNAGRIGLDVSLETGAPFDAPAVVHVGGGERVTVELGVIADRLGLLDGTLLVSAKGSTQAVPLRADALEPPACPARDCRQVTFNPLTGACDETVEADGASCGAGNQCLTEGVCASGQCVGKARSCDDGDACTTDACEPASGCVHDVVSCPLSLRACEVAVCNPLSGCGVAPASDGAACGPNDCTTAQVCITGQCVPRPAPDGSQCAAATSCRGPGVCRQQSCELPAPTELQPAWRYTPQVNYVVAFLGHVDDSGNLYATESGPFNVRNATGQDESGFSGAPVDRSTQPVGVYLLSLTPSGAVRFRVQVSSDCSACTWGLGFSVDSAGRRVFFNAKGVTQARSLDDGHQLWTAVPSAGLPGIDLRADGGAAFMTSPPMLVGSDGVGVPVIEGNSDHHSYVQVFDRATGVFRWQFHRKGHLYGTGVAPGGELWTSSANCWAPAGEMARLDGAGQPQAVKFVQWIPSIYGAGFAVGTASGKVNSLNAAMDLTDLTPITGASASAQPLVSGQQLVLWDNPSRTLHSVNLATGARAFAFQGVTGTSADFELIRDGGVAWTAQVPDAGVLGAIDGHGQELLRCPLPSAVDSPTAIIRGRAYMQSGTDIVGYSVPGLDVEPSGWVTRHGSLQRGEGAR